MLFTDSHAHLYDERFEEDIESVLQSANSEGIHRMIVPSTGIENHERVVEFCKKFKGVCLPAFGLHPTSVNENNELEKELIALEKVINENITEVIAIGECGLDLYWSQEYIANQLFAFRAQCNMAIKYNLPIIIHVRNSFELIHKELKSFKGQLRGVIHGFSGTKEDYELIKNYGEFKFGIGGVITYKNSHLKGVVAQMELNDIILETDSPYLPPVPYRGKRNEPKHIKIIAETVAQLKGCSLEEVSVKSETNCMTLFTKLVK